MNRKRSKLLALGLCSIICLSNVGCSSILKKEPKKTIKSNIDLKNIRDIRTVKVNQEQAMLRFTTQNKAGSISSLELKEKDGKFMYIIDGIDKKGKNIIINIDANTSDIISTQAIGQASKEKSENVLNFAIVEDLKSAVKEASKNVNKEIYNQIDSYKLMYADKKNIYKFTFTNGETEKDKAKKKVVYINASSLKIIGKEEITKIKAFEKTLKVIEPVESNQPSNDSTVQGSTDQDKSGQDKAPQTNSVQEKSVEDKTSQDSTVQDETGKASSSTN